VQGSTAEELTALIYGDPLLLEHSQLNVRCPLAGWPNFTYEGLSPNSRHTSNSLEPFQSFHNMHFALPPRKTSHPPPYARASRSSPIRRKQFQAIGVVACAALVLIYFATRLFSSSTERVPLGSPDLVIVTLMDDATMSDEYRQRIMENRNYYAKKQGRYSNRRKVFQS